MKKALYKDAFKEIKNTYKRFISILLMAFLGVGFFAGIRATSPDMIDTIHKYYETQNVYDIQVVSTLGLTQEDVDVIEKIEGIENVVGTYETDGEIEINESELIAKVMCIEDINKPILLEGRMPEKSTECVVEEGFLKATNKKIGENIQIDIEDTKNEEQEEIPYLKEKNMKIVGVARSPLYLTHDKGTSKLGSGKINYYVMMPKENINASEVFTQMYITLDDVQKYKTSSSKYEERVDEIKTQIENIKEERQEERYNKLVGKANQKVDEAQSTLDKEKKDAQSKIQEASKKIEDGKKEISDAETKIANNEQKAQKEFWNATKQIQSAKKQLEQSEKDFLTKQQEAQKQFENLAVQKQNLQTQLNSVNEGLDKVNKLYKQIEEALKNPILTEAQKQFLEQQQKQAKAQIESLENNKKQIEAGISSIDTGIDTGKQELEQGKKQIEQAKIELQKNENKLNNMRKTTATQLQNAKAELEKAKQELSSGEKELEENKKEFEEKIKEAEAKLVDARDKIAKIEHPKWYILDRDANAGYVGFIQDTESVAILEKYFLLYFLL